MGSGLKKTGWFAVTLFLTMFLAVSAQSSSCSFSFSGNREYATCLSLPQLNSFLHWTYNASSRTADIAFRASGVTVSSTGNWVAWALNPTGTGMIGAQAVVAFKNSSGLMSAYTSSVTTTAISTLKESTLSYRVTELAAESSGTGQIIIFAKIQVPGSKTTVNHVWQVGPLNGGSPAQHPLTTDHQSSFGTLDFLSGVSQAPIGSSPAPATSVSPVPATSVSPVPATAIQPGSTPPAAAQGSGSSSSSLTNGNVMMFALTLSYLALATLLLP